MNRYDDILHLPHHVSSKRDPMSLHDRAAQFSPFAALVGYEDAIREAGRLTDSRITLSDTATEEVDRVLRALQARLEERPHVRLTYFSPDLRKSGGENRSVTGIIRKIDTYRRHVLLEEGLAIPLEEIVSVEILGKTEKL